MCLPQPGWTAVLAGCVQLKDLLTKWKARLEDDAKAHSQERGSDNQQIGEVATEEDSSRIFEGRLTVPPKWTAGLVSMLKAQAMYSPVLINDYIGEVSSATRYTRLEALYSKGLPYTVKMYTHLHNGSRSLHFMWKIPTAHERQLLGKEYETANDRVIMAIKKELPWYSSRATRKVFSDQLNKLGNIALGGTAARKLLQDCFNDVNAEDLTGPGKKGRMERLIKALEKGGEDVITDLRKLNFQTDDPKFDAFWAWMCKEVSMEGTPQYPTLINHMWPPALM